MTVSSEMRLQPNIGSDRSWVWKVAADYSENPPTSETLAIRFANAESKVFMSSSCISSPTPPADAQQFKDAFEKAQKSNAELVSSAPKEESSAADSKAEEAEAEESKAEESKAEEPAAEEKKEEEKKEE